MAKRQREWAKRARIQLIVTLGGECAECGCDDVLELTIDHLFPRRWDLRKVDQSARVCRYRKEAKSGLLQVLCGSCNSAKGRPKAAKKSTGGQPF
jgi:5-methylcytosine-specific restriction endonuclease McrA